MPHKLGEHHPQAIKIGCNLVGSTHLNQMGRKTHGHSGTKLCTMRLTCPNELINQTINMKPAKKGTPSLDRFGHLSSFFPMKLATLLIWLAAGKHAAALQTLFNFPVSPGSVTGSLIQGPDGNFYGTTSHGGPTGNGTVFRVTPAGQLTTLVSDQANPAAGLVVGNDGLLYGLTGAGGAFGFGTAFRMNTAGALTNIAVFDGVNAGNPQSGLVLAPDGNFYGTSQEGGTNGFGAVFRVTPAGVVTTLVSFDFSNQGAFPVAGLTVGPEGNLYGITTTGGAIGDGTIFKVTPGGIFTNIYLFNTTNGFTHRARLALGPDHNLYGTSRDGGSADMGSIFKITTNGLYTSLFSFNGANGSSPQSELTVGADGQLYGTTQLGGAATVGTIFKITTNGALTTLVSFSSGIAIQPLAGLLLASDGNFYGCSQSTVFKLTPGGTLSTLAALIPPVGAHPSSALVLGPDGNFYGTTLIGGSNNDGTIFKMSADGIPVPVFTFNGTNGADPKASLLLARDGNFYGTTSIGGTNNQSGTVFRFSTNGVLTTLFNFGSTNGGNPQCQLVMDTNGFLYGTAPELGPGGDGTVFRITTNGVFTNLVSFNLTNGASPEDGLVLGNDGNLYGITTSGGSHGNGTVFKVTPAGVLTTLVSFNNTNGANPFAALVQTGDGNFYGSTGFGGTNLSFGTLFKMTPTGTLTTLFNFHFTDGEEPVFRMVVGPDGNLYGTTPFGGATGSNPSGTGLGTVFRVTTNGVLTPLVFFQGTNGFNPQAPLVFGPDGNLYGTTVDGGPGGGGTIFRILTAAQFSSIAKTPGGNISLSGSGLPDTAFRIWTSTNLTSPVSTWTMLTNSLSADDGTISFTDPISTAKPAKFYRLSTP